MRRDPLRDQIDRQTLNLLAGKDFNPNEPRNPHTGEWIRLGGLPDVGSIPTAKPDQPSANFDEVYAQGVAEKQGFRELLDLGDGLSKELGADELVSDDLGDFERKAAKLNPSLGESVVVIPPLKDRASAREKLNRKDYGPEGLADLNRASILVGGLAQVPDAFAKTRAWVEAHGWTVHEPDDNFYKGEGVDGYRDVSLTLRSPTGHVTELQFHVAGMWHTKFQRGHKLYERIRALDELNRELTPEEWATRGELLEEMRSLYVQAWAQVVKQAT